MSSASEARRRAAGRPAHGTIEERDGHYFVRLSVKRPDGTTDRPRIPIKGKPPEREGPRCAAWKDEKLKYVAENRERILAALYGTPGGAVSAPKQPRTFAELATVILQARDKDVTSKKLAAATRSEFKTHWRVHIEPFFGSLMPHEVEPRHLLAFRDELAQTKEPRTVKNVFKNLSILFKIVLGRGLDPKLAQHPIRRAVESGILTLPAAEEGPIVFVSRADAAKLLVCAEISQERKVRYAVAFLSGLRDGEIAGLTWADIDLDVLTVDVNKALPKSGGLGKTKTRASTRRIPLHTQAAPFLETWRESGWAKLVGRAPGAADYVFPNEHGASYRPRSPELLRDDLNLVGAAAEVGGCPVDFHATRRSFSTWLEELGAYPETIDRLLGHGPRSVRTQHYSAATIAPMREAIERVVLDGLGGPRGSAPTLPNRALTRIERRLARRPGSAKRRRTRRLAARLGILKTGGGTSRPRASESFLAGCRVERQRLGVSLVGGGTRSRAARHHLVPTRRSGESRTDHRDGAVVLALGLRCVSSERDRKRAPNGGGSPVHS